MSLPVTASLASCFTGKMWPRRPTGWLCSQFLGGAGSWWARALSSAVFSPARAAEEIWKGGGQERSATMPAQVCTKHGLGLVSWGPGPGRDRREGPGFP